MREQLFVGEPALRGVTPRGELGELCTARRCMQVGERLLQSRQAGRHSDVLRQPVGESAGLELMQRFAAELNLSEATFVMPSTRRDCDYRLRIFTPRSEIPMAGHPTIGTAFVLGHGDRVGFEEGVGPILVERVSAPSGAPIWRMTQPRPRFGPHFEDRGAVAAALGLDTDHLDPKLPLCAVATGLPFLMIPLREPEDLARARLQLVPLRRWQDTQTLIHLARLTRRCESGRVPELLDSEFQDRMESITPLGYLEVCHTIARDHQAQGHGHDARRYWCRMVEVGLGHHDHVVLGAAEAL